MYTRKTHAGGIYAVGAGTPIRRTGTVGRVITAIGLALLLGFGPVRAEAEETIVEIARFNGLVQAIKENSNGYVFAGPTATVTIGVQDRLTGAASAPLGLTTSSQTADVGLCYQTVSLFPSRPPLPPTVNFVGGNFQAHYFNTTRMTYTVAASTTPGIAGTYKVGMCIRNNGSKPINNNDFVNGWVQVTRPVN